MDRMNYVDVSSSILFETTADSEADSDMNGNMDGHLCLADDDALSCSCDGNDLNDFETTGYHDQFDLVGDEEPMPEDDDYRNFEDEEDEDDDEEEEEEGVVEQFWNGDNCNNKTKDLKNPTNGRSLPNYSPGVLMEKKQRRKKLKICAEDFMNQRDRDKLFWETCLAS